MSASIEQILDLLGQVPRPPDAPPIRGASSESLQEFERSTGIELPDEIRQWWSVCDGDMAGPGGLYGVDPYDDFLSVRSVYELYPQWTAARWVPIAGDGTGCQYVADLNDGVVGFVDTSLDDSEISWVAASGVPEFLRFLLQSELGEKRWPFRSEYVLAMDPKLAEYRGDWPLPWDE